VNVFVQPENHSLEAIATLFFSRRRESILPIRLFPSARRTTPDSW